MKIVRMSELPEVPWKNGGGLTRASALLVTLTRPQTDASSEATARR